MALSECANMKLAMLGLLALIFGVVLVAQNHDFVSKSET